MNSDEKLARVTYLPGVTPPAAPVPAFPAAEEPSADDRQAQEHRAENVSMHALTRRGMSRWELGEALLARDLDPCIVEAELDRLEGVGLIDDTALAETIVRTQRERKGLGRTALVAELRRRRIDQDIIEGAIEEFDEDDERERAQQLAIRRAAQLRNLDHATAVRRLSGYLQRKGYSSETVRGAVLMALPRQPSGVRFR
ncbi:regulatory protein RecX [Leifsonia bigeumensis]|uniref:Regulatory protein RecX n=1 Tax=Leifsonella bigeumensis TaxID=433643 RepID=A0ABP7FNJ0_9MICO